MKKIIIGLTLGAIIASADMCQYHTDNLVRDGKSTVRAMELGMNDEAFRLIRMNDYTTKQILLTCDKNFYSYKAAENWRKEMKKLGVIK